MTKIYSVLLLLVLLIPWQVKAQGSAVQGVVISSEDLLPIPGATVLEKGTTNGTSTDLDGKFVLQNVSPQSTLIFSYVGMKSQEILLTSGQNYVKVTLDLDISLLNEVVVIGYGTVKKKDVTGAVSIVDSKTISKLNPVKIEQALQGTITGVNVTEQSGAPGAGL
ncbi:MAG: carboxypeptidase-like regulatory domain-containing protein, partial [Bacteroidetes bacterium]|nr:carboxypeptidase-like regulatory domain-containing protein [Bacteroidota bacterium]